MPDSQRDNPYASPLAEIELADTYWPESENAWRDGEVLVLVPRRARLPRACWVTNRSRWTVASPLVDDAPAVLIVLGLCQVPVVGLILALPVAILLTIQGRMAMESTRYVWLSWPLSMLRSLVAFATGVLFVFGLILSHCALGVLNAGLITGGVCMAVPVVMVVGLQLYVYAHRDRLVLGLEARREGHLVRVRGVHPDYLSRLPPWPGSEV